ncbi:unnamed protein product [Urochloa humidicola]
MVSLDVIRDHVASIFIMLNKKTVILFRIELLVVLAILLFFAMFLMDFFRRIIHNSFMRAVFSVFDAVSDSIVVYLLGAMQTAPFKNQLFPVWALVLVNFRYSADYISGYGVPDRRGRRFTEWRNVFKLLGSAFLNSTRGSSIMVPLWSVWCVQIVRSAYRFYSHRLASTAVWHGRSSQLVAEHMRATYAGSSKEEEFVRQEPMKSYRYLVYGETKQKGGFKLKKPQYALSIDEPATGPPTQHKTAPPLITLDKVEEYGEDKDIPLAFALSRLLRCRLEDVTLEDGIFDINRKLVKDLIDRKVATSDALKIMELQLAFLHDYFNTRYPMVFWRGLPSLFVSLFLSVLTMCAVLWLAVDIRKVYKPPSSDLANTVKGFNVDMIITWGFISLMILKEIWEMCTYLHSDWTSLIMGCEYAQRKCKRSNKQGSSDTWLDRILLYFTRAKITDRRWHGFIDQYVFVQSYDDRPRVWNLIHNLTTGIVPKKDDGAALSSAIKVPGEVRDAVLMKIQKIITDQPDCVHLPSVVKRLADDSSLGRQLKNYQAYTARRRNTQILMPSSTQIVLPTSTQTVLPKNTQIVLSTSSCIFEPTSTNTALPTSSHIILVWHIATSLCEMELATNYGVNLSKPGFPCSLLSWFISCCSSKDFLLDVGAEEDINKKNNKGSSIWSCFTSCCLSKSNGEVPEELRKAYIVANSLSRYCAYLLVSKPDLIPDTFLVPNIVFQRTVKSASGGILKDCDSLMKRYENLKVEAEKPIKIFENEDVLKQGVALGKELLNHPTEDGRWQLLSDVWTELLVHIAATKNAQAHKKCLSGGEFISHIWALLWHHGIQKSNLWPADDGPETNNDSQVVVTLGNYIECAGNEGTLTGGDMTSNLIGSNLDEATDNKGPKQNEADNSRTGPCRTMEETESPEIEENSQDTILETGNVSRGMAVEARN